MSGDAGARRDRSPWLGLLWSLLPLGIGAAGAAVAVPAARGLVLVQETDVGWLPFLVGAAVAALVAIATGARAIGIQASARAAAAARTAEREDRRRFVARLDHEIKNPLTAMRVGLSNLAAVGDLRGQSGGRSGSEPVSEPGPGIALGVGAGGAPDGRRGARLDAEALAAIDAQAQRLTRLLADLRKLGELESVALEVAPVDLEALAREVVDAVQELPEASEREIVVVFPRAPRPLPDVPGDADLLFLALYNLVANAVKYSGPGDRVEVRGSDGDGVATIEVADTGPGIPESEHALVWEELGRGSGTRHVAGSGLGLPFVRAIASRHGGRVVLRSRTGEGAVLRLTLPV